MVLTKSELIASLQNEVRILLHLGNKIDRSMLDYRPTPRNGLTRDFLTGISGVAPDSPVRLTRETFEANCPALYQTFGGTGDE